MLKVMSIILLFTSTLIFVVNARSQGLPEHLPEDYSKLTYKEVGRAKFSVLFWDIYNSTLYTISGQYFYKNPPETLLFKIEYLKDITSDELIERTIEQWRHLQIPEPQYKPFIPQLKAIWPNISAGDSLTLFVENETSVFYLNNIKIGIMNEHEFSQIFLDIWLSPETSQMQLRKQLLEGSK